MSRYLKDERNISRKKSAGNGNNYNLQPSRKPFKEITNTCNAQKANKIDNTKKNIDVRVKSSKSIENTSQIHIKVGVKSVTSKNSIKVIQEASCIVRKSYASDKKCFEKTGNNKQQNIKNDKNSGLIIKEGNGFKNSDISDNKRRESRRSEVEDPYKKYEDNVFLCTPYVKDIYNYFHSLENQFAIKPDFLRGTSITPRIRAILIDWMIDIQLRFKLSNESFHLSVYLVDRYLSIYRNTEKNELELLALSCSFIAGKYDSVHPPHLEDFVRSTDPPSQRMDVIKMERKIFKTVNMKLSKPPITCFLRRFGIVANIDKAHHNCSKFFVDSCLLNYTLCHYKSSLIAAAATYISLCFKFETASTSVWNEELIVHSKYTVKEFQHIVKCLVPFIIDLPTKKYSSALIEKYKMQLFCNVKEIIYKSKGIELLQKITMNLNQMSN